MACLYVYRPEAGPRIGLGSRSVNNGRSDGYPRDSSADRGPLMVPMHNWVEQAAQCRLFDPSLTLGEASNRTFSNSQRGFGCCQRLDSGQSLCRFRVRPTGRKLGCIGSSNVCKPDSNCYFGNSTAIHAKPRRDVVLPVTTMEHPLDERSIGYA